MDQRPENAEPTAELTIQRFDEGEGWSERLDTVVRESLLQIVCNARDTLTISCLGSMARELIHGYLLGAGRILSADDVASLEYDAERGVAFVELRDSAAIPLSDLTRRYLGSGCGEAEQALRDEVLVPLAGPFDPVTAGAISDAAGALQRDSALFRRTGGVHAVALCDTGGRVVVRAEDIGRHNAFDKVAGYCLLNRDADPARMFGVATGRISSDIVIKAWRLGLGLLVSRSAPTTRAVDLARATNVGVIGFARGRRFNVYHGEDRVRAD
jgi:FdhD protein